MFILFVLLISLSMTGAQQCSNGYEYFEDTGYCYKTYIPIVTRRTALIHCQTEGGSLASIHSLEENNYIVDLYNRTAIDLLGEVPSYSQIWIGNEYDPYSGKFSWSDRSEVNFTHFMEEETQNRRDESSATIDISEAGEWRSNHEGEYVSYACKKSIGENMVPNIPKECSEGYQWEETTGNCYKVIFKKSTFQDANQLCMEEGAYLLSIHSPEEHISAIRFYKNQLKRNFQGLSYVHASYLWTGLSYENDAWTWSDGSNVDWAYWDNPRFGAPLDGENWAVINITTAEPRLALGEKWINVGEPNYFSFICKKPDTSVAPKISKIHPIDELKPSTQMSISTNTDCSEGYQYFEKTGFCYKFGRETVNFTIANDNCLNENAQLASIHSEEEDQFLIKLAEEVIGTDYPIDLEFYIGFVYKNKRWQWTDGTPVDYAKWMEAEPNFIYNEVWTSMSYRVKWERAVVHDGWNNMMGEQERAYFCKKSAL